MMDWIILGIVAAVVGFAVSYIRKEKRRGVACVGCPDAKSCSGACSGCGGCCGKRRCGADEPGICGL